MPKWAKWAAVAAICGVAVAAALVRAQSGLPVYAGRSLAEWLKACGEDVDVPNPEARAAVATILTNNLSWALQCLEYDPTPKRRKQLATYSKLPPVARRSPLLMQFLTRDRDSINLTVASAAFEVAGPDAKAAVPELTRLMLNTNSQFTSLQALRALSYIGPAAQGPLEMVFTNQSYPFRVAAVRLLVPRGSTGCAHLLPLVMEDPDPALRTAATNALLSRGLNPAQVFKSPD